MKIEYSANDDRVELIIADQSDGRLFNGVADEILRHFNGRLIRRLGGTGIDQRYWDIQIGDLVVILFLEHCAGITLYAGDSDANDLIRQIGRHLETTAPKLMFRETFYLKNFFRIRR